MLRVHNLCNVTEAKGVRSYRDVTYDEDKKKNPLNLTITEVSDHSYGISFFSPSPEDIFFSRCLYSERKGRERDIHDRET